MNTYIVEWYPNGWMHVIREPLTNCIGEQIDQEICERYSDAVHQMTRGRAFANDGGVIFWNNCAYWKGEADNLESFIRIFFRRLHKKEAPECDPITTPQPD